MNDDVYAHLLAQAGTISRAQALSGGVTRRQLDTLLASGEWLRVHAGVYRARASVPLPETDLWAAALWLGDGALLADEGAAWWWGALPAPPSAWTFVGPSRCRGTDRVRVLDTYVDPRDRWRHRAIAVTSPALSVLRAAATLEQRRPGEGIALIDRSKQTRVVRQSELQRAFERHAGCRGSTVVRTLLRRTGGEARSELERLAVSALRRAGITGFRPNHTVRLSSGRSVEIDIAFPDRRIAIELDGYAYHSSADSFRTDLRRANALMRDGWTVRRFSWDDLVADPDGFVAAVLELLAR